MSDETPIEGLWKTDPDQCCDIFKVQPTLRALEGLDAWITGLRRTEGRTLEEGDRGLDGESTEAIGSEVGRIRINSEHHRSIHAVSLVPGDRYGLQQYSTLKWSDNGRERRKAAAPAASFLIPSVRRRNERYG